MTVAAVIQRAEADEALQAALEEVGGQGNKINPRIVGRWIERQVGRRIDGLRFERGVTNRHIQATRFSAYSGQYAAVTSIS
jgi:hypothetical protein